MANGTRTRTRTRIGMVGAGGVGQRHVATLSGLDDVTVVAVADTDPQRAAALATACGATAYDSAAELLDRERVDALYVCVPPFAHGAPEQAALERRVPFFVEKPLGVDLAVAERIATAVSDADLLTGTGYHWRCLDTVQRAQELLADRPARLVQGQWLDKVPPVPWWVHADRSGGQVVEQLTHVLDLARAVVGEAVEVYAAGVRTAVGSSSDADVDDVTVATMRFASGALGTIAATCLLGWKHVAALQVVAPGMTLSLSETELVVDDGRTRTLHRPAADPRVQVDREFVDAVQGRRAAVRVPYAEALRTHRLGCALATSARAGQPVTVEDGADG
jgi:predicted dehydrogenase